MKFNWKNLFLVSVLAAGLYVFMEWLFIVTKPSFMDAFSWLHKTSILLFAASLLAALCALLLLPFFLLGRLPPLRRIDPYLLQIAAIVPAFVLACLALLLVDNFTYNLFHFGIINTVGFVRGVYAAGFIGALAYLYYEIRSRLKSSDEPAPARRFDFQRPRLFAALLLAALLPASLTVTRNLAAPQMRIQAGGVASRALPDIIFITGDGINAKNASLYGYERDTTPYLREELAPVSLVAENAYTNSGNTTGSITSTLTGKYPAQTRVLYPPNVLLGSDTYVHLPGILRSLGYRNIQLTVHHYADAYAQNFQDGFDYVNGRTQTASPTVALFSALIPTDDAYFVSELYQRIADRLAHIFFIRTMENPYQEVTQTAKDLEERIKIRRLLTQLRETEQPLFAHLHIMNTHGPYFRPSKQVFSEGQSIKEQERWNIDFYDDAILEFDRYIGQVIKELKSTGRLDDTILIVGSDHGMNWNNLERIPLLIRFPNGEHAGRITANVQYMDITPTLLDYLGISQPAVMRGQSLFTLPQTPRPIFTIKNSMGVSRVETGFFELNLQKVYPPFYQFTEVSVIYCQQWFRLWTVKKEWNRGEIEGHTSPCPADQLLSDEQAFDLIVGHLKENGFDTASLSWPLPAP